MLVKERVEIWINKLGLSGRDAEFLRKYASFMESMEELNELKCIIDNSCPYKQSFDVIRKHIGVTTDKYIPLESEED